MSPLFLFSAVLLGAQGRKTLYGPTEMGWTLSGLDELTVEEDVFEKFNMKWEMKLQKNGDKVSAFLKPLGDVSNYVIEFSVRFDNPAKRTMIERTFIKDFSKGATEIGSANFISYDELMNPENGIVVNGKANLRIKITMESC